VPESGQGPFSNKNDPPINADDIDLYFDENISDSNPPANIQVLQTNRFNRTDVVEASQLSSRREREQSARHKEGGEQESARDGFTQHRESCEIIETESRARLQAHETAQVTAKLNVNLEQMTTLRRNLMIQDAVTQHINNSKMIQLPNTLPRARRISRRSAN
jgi:hypothetical protein